MTKAHTGFAAGGVQAHSAGEYFPVTTYQVGGWPPSDPDAYFVVQHPCGIKRRAWSIEGRDTLIDAFVEAHEFVTKGNVKYVDEIVAFWLALDAIDRRGDFIGFTIED